MKDSWLFLSLGAGVQSSALLMLYYHGILKPMPDAAIFADTQAEPFYVYENLQRLTKAVKDKIHVAVATKGNLATEELNPQTSLSKDGSKFARTPFYTHDGQRVGMGRRQCTREFKISVIYKEMRRLMGYRPGQRIKETVQLAVGISRDEWMRGKDSRERWVKNIFPLMADYTRQDCLQYIAGLGMERPLRSACYFCPYHSNDEWREMKQESPDTFAKAVQFDTQLREVATYRMKQYVHHLCEPLADAVERIDNQPSLFETHECEGMCGV